MELRIILLFGTVVLLVGIWRGENSIAHSYHLQRSAEALRQHIAQLTADNKQLADEIKKLRNSKSYARRVLRDRYHLVEDDENIIFFAD